MRPIEVQDAPGRGAAAAVEGARGVRRRALPLSRRRADVLSGVSFTRRAGPDWWRCSARPAPARARSINLIPRFYDVTGGSVRSTATTCATSRWPACAARSGSCCKRRCCSAARVRDNIAYGQPDATQARDRGRGARRPGARLHRRAAPGLRHAGRRARRRALRRPAPAHGDRAGAAARPAPPDPGRQHLGGGRRDRGGHPGGARPPDARAAADGVRDRPADQHRARRRPGSWCWTRAGWRPRARTRSCCATASSTTRSSGRSSRRARAEPAVV